MKKVVIACLLGSMMSVWALDLVVSLGNPNGGGGMVTTGDPLPHEEWD